MPSDWRCPSANEDGPCVWPSGHDGEWHQDRYGGRWTDGREMRPESARLARRGATMAIDGGHQIADFEMMPDLLCGRSYRNPESEAIAVAMRTCEVTPYTGCGKPMRWVYAYRCRQCGRWMHGPCMDRHFSVVGCPATRDGQADLTAENARLAGQVAALREAGERIIEALGALDGAPSGGDLCDAWDWVDDAALDLRAALAAASEGSSLVTTRTITMRCHCGRGVTIGPDPWCEGCVQSAATCDCVPATQGEG